jgi:putative DNA primase/helicase
MEISALHLAKLLNGEVVGLGRCLVPGFGHSPADRSLSISVDEAYPDGFWVHSFAGDNELAAKREICRRLGIVGHSKARYDTPHANKGQSTASKAANAESLRKTALGIEIWSDGRDPRGSPVEWHLCSRGLKLPAGDALRWHPDCPFGTSRSGCMIALVRNIITNEPQAIHRTALTPQGEKVSIGGCDRKALGPLLGGAIKLVDDADTTTVLAIAEGVESALSMQLLVDLERISVWALVSASGITAFQTLAGIEVLWIGVDHDKAGMAAARHCAARWQKEGHEVRRLLPPIPGEDVNDLVIRRVAV